jgi:hypothetical protein
MKREEHNPMEPVDKQHYKKRYLLRKLEEQEADKLIKTYNNEHEPDTPAPEDEPV